MHRFLVLAVPALVLLLAGSGTEAKDRPDAPARRADQTHTTGPQSFNAADFLREYDRNKDGFLSRDELPRWMRHHFQRLDVNKDGKISKEELEKGERYVRRHRPSDVMFVLVEMSDCDECSLEELQRVYEMLRKMDRNHNGVLELAELKAAREALGKERVDEIFEDLDANKDGKISKDEARGQLKKNFAELDRNKDGFIDRDELLNAVLSPPADALRKAVPDRAKQPLKPERRNP